MTDLDLFTYAATRGMVRNSNPETSVKAAVKVIAKQSKLHEAILSVLKSEGPLNDRELENRPEFWTYAPSTVRKRRTELYQAGLVESCGEKDGLTVWRVAQ